MSGSIRAVCDDASLDALATHKENVALFVALQLMRTPTVRRGLANLLDMVKDEPNENGQPAPYIEDLDRAAHIWFVEAHVGAVMNALLQMTWVMVHNPTDQPFWISDCPVARHNYYATAYGMDASFECEGIEVALPLSPCLALTLHDRALPITAGGLILATRGNVRFMNAQQMYWARETVFSPTGDFAYATELRAKHPDWAVPQRTRIITTGLRRPYAV